MKIYKKKIVICNLKMCFETANKLPMENPIATRLIDLYNLVSFAATIARFNEFFFRKKILLGQNN